MSAWYGGKDETRAAVSQRGCPFADAALTDASRESGGANLALPDELTPRPLVRPTNHPVDHPVSAPRVLSARAWRGGAAARRRGRFAHLAATGGRRTNLGIFESMGCVTRASRHLGADITQLGLTAR